MRVIPIQFNNKTEFGTNKTKKTNLFTNFSDNNAQFVTKTDMFTKTAPQPSFEGITLKTKGIKNIAQEMFPKANGIFTPDGNFIDLKKITFDNLISETLDIADPKVSKDKIKAYRAYIALLEGYAKNPADTGEFATQWGKKFGPDNISSPPALLHYLGEVDVREEVYKVNREQLKNFKRNKSLDIPIFDEKDNFHANGVVYDSETTGANVDEDEIVQLGAIIVKDGKVHKVYDQLINPGRHIPEEASAKNRITDDMVEKAPSIVKATKDFLTNVMVKENGIIMTWNGVKFDMPLLNRTIRQIREATGITEGHPESKIIAVKQAHKVVDAQILMMRIHPFSGLSKKLGLQYHLTFCSPMEDAHNALADCHGTLAMTEYVAGVLNKHRIDKTKPLTWRQVLLFQNGELDTKLTNIDIPLNPIKGFNTTVDYGVSYQQEPMPLMNYFDKYNLSRENINAVAEEIGEENYKKLNTEGIIDSVIDDTYKGHPLQAEETKKIPGTDKKKNLAYEIKENLHKLVVDIAKIDGYNGKTKEEIFDIIAQKSMHYTDSVKNDKLSKGLWVKNVDSDEISLGNDLPDDEITRRVKAEINEMKKFKE